MKDHKTYLRKIVLLLILTVLTIVHIKAQDHVTKDNYTGNWEDAGTWQLGGVPTEPISMSTQVDIYGKTIKNSTLNVNKDFTLYIYDTLIIYGDFDLNKDGNIFVEPGAFLIVYGNFSSAKDIEIDLSSYLLVFGDFDLTNSASITTPAGDTLLYATGTVDCAGGCSATTVGDEDDMFNNPELDEIIEATSNFITPRSPSLCVGGSLVLSIRDDGTNYEWFETSTPGTILSTEPTLTITTTGSYDVNYDKDGMAQVVDPVTVTSSGTVAFSISGAVTNASGVGLSDGEIDLTVTPSGTYTYDWSNGETTEDLSGLAAGNYTVEVEDDDCRLSETFSVTDVPCTDPALSTVTTPTICNGSSYDLSNIVVVDANGTSPTYTYHSGTPALPGNELASTTVSPTTTTTYYILGTNGSCTDELAVDVTVNPLPVFTISGSAASVCDGEEFTLTTTFTTINTSYSIDIQKDGSSVSGYPLSSSNNPTYVYNENLVWTGPGVNNSFSYSVTIIDTNGCSDSTTTPVSVDVYKKPETGPQYHISNDYGN